MRSGAAAQDFHAIISADDPLQTYPRSRVSHLAGQKMTASDTRAVRAKRYSERMDLRGRDLVSCLGQAKANLSEIVGCLASREEMSTVQVPVRQITSMTGEVADEIHEWPKATLGKDFHCLTLQFLGDRLITVVWNIEVLKPGRPWWKFWG